MHWLTGLYRTYRHIKSLTSLLFDAICSIFIYGLWTKFMCRKSDKLEKLLLYAAFNETIINKATNLSDSDFLFRILYIKACSEQSLYVYFLLLCCLALSCMWQLLLNVYDNDDDGMMPYQHLTDQQCRKSQRYSKLNGGYQCILLSW